METGLTMPKSTLDAGAYPKSAAFEMRKGRLLLKFEQEVPYVSKGGHEFCANEQPSIVLAGKKFAVAAIL